MASEKLLAAFLIFIICSSTFANATDCGCTPAVPAPKPKPTPSPTTPAVAHCPRDALKLGVCANVLNLVNVKVGDPVTKPCCSLLKGLADLEAAACLCTAIKANILGNNLVAPVALSALVSACQKTIPPGFQCK